MFFLNLIIMTFRILTQRIILKNKIRKRNRDRKL